LLSQPVVAVEARVAEAAERHPAVPEADHPVQAGEHRAQPAPAQPVELSPRVLLCGHPPQQSRTRRAPPHQARPEPLRPCETILRETTLLPILRYAAPRTLRPALRRGGRRQPREPYLKGIRRRRSDPTGRSSVGVRLPVAVDILGRPAQAVKQCKTAWRLGTKQRT
jgi:hypothetical protein